MGSSRLALVLAAAVAAAIATTRLSPHIPPNRLLLALAAAAAVAALLVPERHRRHAAIGGAAAAGLASAHVLLRAGMPQVHDLDHVWGLWAYARAVRAGSIAPMWIPDLGAGMPLLQFYGPVSFLLDLPGILLGLAPVALWKEATAQASLLAAISALAAARLLGAGWRGASIAACAIAFAPWRLAVFHFRGALGEATAFLFAPLVAAACLRLVRGPSRAAAATLAVATALLIPTHLITLFCLAILLVPAVLVERGWKRVLAAAAPALIGVGVVAGWWLPAMVEGKHTSLPLQTETHHYLIYDEHGLDPSDMLVRRAWDTSRPSLKRSDRAAGQEGQQMPFYVGLVLFGAALTAPWWSRSRATWGPAAGAATALVLASAPVALAMTHLPLVHTIQFPWRFLSAGSILAALAVGLGASAVLETADGWRKALPALALPLLLVSDAAPYTGASGWLPPYTGVTHWVLADGHSPDEPFDVRMRAVPDPTHGARLGRVGGLQLPPADLTTDVALFWLPYPEWTTPAFYRGFLATQDPREFGEGAVSWFFLPRREAPLPIPAKPFATVVAGGAESGAGPVARSPGRIEVRAEVPAGGGRLIVREQAFPGWLAKVDGRPASIEPTPLGFISLALPEGRRSVELTYHAGTPSRRAGVLVTSLAFLCVPLYVWRVRSSSRRG